MADVGELKVKITADSSQLEKATKKSSESMKELGKTVALVTAAAAAAGVALLTKLVSAQMASIDASAKLADKLGVSMEAMGGLEYIADITGTSIETMGKAIQGLNRTLITATDSSTSQAAALKQLGLSVSELQQLSPDQAFYKIADAIGAVENSTVQAQLAFELFGGEGNDLIGVMRSTHGHFQELAQEAVDLGYAISREAAAKVEQFNDQITKIKYVGEGLARQLTIQLAPALTEVANAFYNSARNGGTLRAALDTIASAASAALKEIARTIRTLDAMRGREQAQNQTDAAEHYQERLRQTRQEIDQMHGGLANLTRDANDITSSTSRASQALLNRYNGMMNLAQQTGQEAANSWQRIADIAEGNITIPSPTGGGGGGGTAGPMSGGKDNRSAIMEQLYAALQTEEEAERESYEKRQQMIREMQESNMLTQQEAYNMELDLLSDHEDKLNEIRERGMTEAEQFSKLSWHRQTATALGELGALMQGVEGNSRKMFRIQKAGALAMAIVNTYEGVSRSLSKYPMPLAAVMSAAHLAAGLNQVNAIRKTQYGGGGGGGGAAIPTPSTGDTDTGGMSGQGQTGKRDVRIVIDAEDNSLFSGRQVRDLMGRIGNELSNGENFGSFQVVRA